MQKTSKCLLAENPMMDNNEEFILHTRDPRFLLKVNHLEIDQVMDSPPLGHTVFFASSDTGLPEFYELEVIQEYNGTPRQKDIELAGKWWREYLKFEEGAGVPVVRDFHPKILGLKVFQRDNSFLTIYKGVVKKHKTEQCVLGYINETFNSKFDSLEGYICSVG